MRVSSVETAARTIPRPVILPVTVKSTALLTTPKPGPVPSVANSMCPCRLTLCILGHTIRSASVRIVPSVSPGPGYYRGTLGRIQAKNHSSAKCVTKRLQTSPTCAPTYRRTRKSNPSCAKSVGKRSPSNLTSTSTRIRPV
uniref:Uncharacterized protein n=1 Tax=Cacopsylla melanoneura TaxID=428564 RepID=A0A8D8X8N8_9HEMI